MENNLQSHAPEQNNNHEQSSFIAKTKIALTSLLITMGAFSYGQTATQGKTDTQTEQLTTTDDSKAKADVDNLMKKYNVATLDDIGALSSDKMINMRTELLILLKNNSTLSYYNSVHKFATQLFSDLDLFTTEQEFNRELNQTALNKLHELAKNKDELAKNKDELAKNKDELAKAKKENEEVRQVAQQY